MVSCRQGYSIVFVSETVIAERKHSFDLRFPKIPSNVKAGKKMSAFFHFVFMNFLADGPLIIHQSMGTAQPKITISHVPTTVPLQTTFITQ